MKTKIIVGLTIYAILFLGGGLYVLHLIGSTTNRLDNLIMLHQVEILREHYLIQIRRVQTDLALRETRFARDTDTIVSHVRSMGRVVRTCSDCHHDAATAARLEDLERRTIGYQEAISRVMTVRAGADRIRAERDNAFQVGEDLIEQVSDMIALTGARLEASTQRALASIRKTTGVLLFLLAAGPLVSIGLGFVFVRGITRPLGVLLDTTRRLSAGELDYRVPGLSDEFGQLGEAFNTMASSLREHIVGRQRAEQMAALGRLSAGLAHEIKNPLAGIKVAMEILAGEESMTEENRDVARKVRQEVVRVETLMRSFLTFARPPRPQPAEVDVDALIASSLSLYGRDPRFAPAHARPIRLVREAGSGAVAVADPAQLEQVVVNLLLNALEAMPEGGTLVVRTGADPDGMVRIEVADSGKGVPPESRERIFEPFFTTKGKGTGLGLAISRQLIEQQGGTLRVADNPGGGAVFTVRIPARTAGAESAA
ncbi:MAG: ATP-binding protein [Acidobacteria bacterium]|jgi:signal transduction histidine kinase|nr:ATP-binding protein [Acidobacteriota bacterium]